MIGVMFHTKRQQFYYNRQQLCRLAALLQQLWQHFIIRSGRQHRSDEYMHAMLVEVVQKIGFFGFLCWV